MMKDSINMSRSNLKSHTMNMTEGNPTGLLIRFAIPMLIGNLFQQVYNVVDSIIVGRYIGAQALAAVGATSSTTFLFFALCNQSVGRIVEPWYVFHVLVGVDNTVRLVDIAHDARGDGSVHVGIVADVALRRPGVVGAAGFSGSADDGDLRADP